MEFMLSAILAPIVVGLPLSIYTGLIAGRYLVFRQLISDCIELLWVHGGPYDCAEETRLAARQMERLEAISSRLDSEGHAATAEIVWNIAQEVAKDIATLQTSFEYSEVRMKNSSTRTTLSGEVTARAMDLLQDAVPSCRGLFGLKMKVFRGILGRT